MRITIGFFTFLVLCLLLATLLAPSVNATGWFAVEPQRLLNRLAQLFIFIGISPLLWALALLNRSALGYGVPHHQWLRNISCGITLGSIMLMVLVLALLALGIRIPDLNRHWWPDLSIILIQAIIGGLLIGFIEETFFRGALYSAIRRHHSRRTAAINSALLYAAVHFLKPAALPTGATFDHASAWTLFIHTFSDALNWQHLDSFIALFLCGILLALIRERSGHIGWCIGIHAGWVLVIQLTRWLTDSNTNSPLIHLTGHYDGIIGWLAAGWIALIIIIYRWLNPHLTISKCAAQ